MRRPVETSPLVIVASRNGTLCRGLWPVLGLMGIRPQIVSHCADVSTLTDRPVVVVVDVASVRPESQAIQLGRGLHQRWPRWLYLAEGKSAAERVRLLRAGADDVVSPPFDIDEVGLRVGKLIELAHARPTRLVVGELSLDEETREVVWRDRVVRLSPTEFGVLRLLVRHAGSVLSKERILLDVWGYGSEGDGHSVELYVSYVRKKLGRDGIDLISTVRGAGYVFRSVPVPTTTDLAAGRAEGYQDQADQQDDNAQRPQERNSE